MSFKIKLTLPSTSESVLVNELQYKFYRSLVKGLHETNTSNINLQINLILKELIPNIDIKKLTLEDKLAVYLAVREICVNPDLKLKGTCEETAKPFNWITEVKSITENLKKINLNYSFKELNVEGSFTGIAINHEIDYMNEPESLFTELITLINYLKIENIHVELNTSFKERKSILELLPGSILKTLIKHLQNYLTELDSITLLEVKSPYTNKVLLRYTGQLTVTETNNFIKYLYLENLNNIYRSFYNVVKRCQFTPEYLDSITPAEMQVYWSYFITDLADNGKTKNTTSNALPQTDELGFN
jgi:hypothetical protein